MFPGSNAPVSYCDPINLLAMKPVIMVSPFLIKQMTQSDTFNMLEVVVQIRDALTATVYPVPNEISE